MNRYHMTTFFWIPLVILGCGKGTPEPNIPLPQPPQPREYTFGITPSWADEFDYEGLPDEGKWGYDVGSENNGWGNNELQYYTERQLENAIVGDGVLTITAIHEDHQG